ncbi:MAG: hypothetical protein ACOY4O_01500 [Pseudomonadota bacterium]
MKKRATLADGALQSARIMVVGDAISSHSLIVSPVVRIART